MTKRDLVVRIADETGLIQQQVLTLIQKILDHIAAAITRGQKVELRNFGIFEVKVQKARIGRNPRKPAKEVRIPARAMVKFRAGRELDQEVFKLSPARKAVLKTKSPSPTKASKT